MLSIYANAIRVATRLEPAQNPKTPAKVADRKRWLPKGHWWLHPERSIDETSH